MKNELNIIPFSSIEKYQNNSNYEIIDLRNRQEYIKGHVEGAVNMPDFSYKDMNGLSKNVTYILYCNRGSLSFRMARAMLKKGYKVMTVAGGYQNKMH